MPRRLHEALVALLHNLPETVADVLVELGELPTQARQFNSAQRLSFGEAQTIEARPDLVVLCGSDLVLLVEVQRRRDAAKKWTWPLYVALALRHFGRPARVVVVTPSLQVARWARAPIRLGGPGDVIMPLVLGPDTVPCITDIGQARARPGAALLSAIVHAESAQAAQAALAGLYAVEALAEDQQFYYNDLILGQLSESDLLILEAMMHQQDSARPALIGVPKGYTDSPRKVGIARQLG